MKFTAWDEDNDFYVANCASLCAGMPLSYNSCWIGSLNGGSESSNNLNQPYNGAYWMGGFFGWGTPGGDGAGNGWFYVR